MDAKATASSSRFMPQSQEDKVQFQLEAFMFLEGNSPSVRTECLMNLLSLLSALVSLSLTCGVSCRST